MSKNEYWILNIVGGVCAVLMVVVLVLGYMNEGLNQSAVAGQNMLNKAQQAQSKAQTILGRVFQDSQKEPALADLLLRYDFRFGTNLPVTSPGATQGTNSAEPRVAKEHS
ncbi:MAG: hypothetical protein C5B50_25160 [Verrucomicrobia bacterium]|nr:MAG: hypothetical protein C5B50_25160 [Verrucomicrobiota bacterium]